MYRKVSTFPHDDGPPVAGAVPIAEGDFDLLILHGLLLVLPLLPRRREGGRLEKLHRSDVQIIKIIIVYHLSSN